MQKLVLGGACWLGLLGVLRADGQAVGSPDTTATAAAGAAYTRLVQPESVLFNGPEYVNYVKPGTIGHQFWGTASPQRGTVTYRGATFEAVLLSYDLVLDQLVLTYPNQAATVTLVPEKVANFTLGSRRFIRLPADSTAGGGLPVGYYEVLLTGPVSLLARHTKRLAQTTVQQNLRLEFRQTDQLFVRTAGGGAELTNLRSLLALLPAHQAEVQRYAQEQQLRFDAAQREASARRVLGYYATLNQ